MIGFYFELDDGFYTHPDMDVGYKNFGNPFDLYKIILKSGSEKDKIS